MTHMTIHIPRRAVTLVAAGGLALSGAAALATGWSASAASGNDTVHQVWVCKYVQKPAVREVLKGGKNPIYVDWHSLTGRTTAPMVGDTFSDAQLKSVVVQIGGSSPGPDACGAVTPEGTTTTSKPTKTTPSTTTTTSKPTETTATTTTTTSAGGGGGSTGGGGGGMGGGAAGAGGVGGGVGGVTGPVPGVAAPHTGGEGDTSSTNEFLGSGLLAGGLALAVGEAIRRRRENATR